MKIESYLPKEPLQAVYFDGYNDVEEIANWAYANPIWVKTDDARGEAWVLDIPEGPSFFTVGPHSMIYKDGEHIGAMDADEFRNRFEKTE